MKIHKQKNACLKVPDLSIEDQEKNYNGYLQSYFLL